MQGSTSRSRGRRYNRQKLKAHDAGHDRHNKELSFLKKQERLASTHNRAIDAHGKKRKRKHS